MFVVRLMLFFVLFIFTINLHSQIISILPSNGGADAPLTLIFDASQGNQELINASKIYLHHGVVTDSENGTAWKHVIGNWGKDDGIGLMTKIEGEEHKWKIDFSPTIRSYFNANENENIFRISCVFRSADGNQKGTIAAGNYSWGTVTSNLDMYVDLNVGNFIQILTPEGEGEIINAGQSLPININVSNTASDIKLYLNEGAGYDEVSNNQNSKTLNYDYFPSNSLNLGIKVEAMVNGESISSEKQYNIVIKKATIIAPVPLGMLNGFNKDDLNPQKATFVLLAPEKDFIYLVGDMTSWKVDPAYQMYRDPDGERYWITIDGLEEDRQYVYQYWIDDVLKVADPYGQLVADPWNDQYIPSNNFPDLPNYDKKEFGIASVFSLNEDTYQWSSHELVWQKPNVDQLVIYELLVRDFSGTSSYKDVIDSLEYIKNLGVNALEIMPVNEFEGNDSWGYNPSFYFAPDKYYGTKNDLKTLIDKAHNLGMAVIMDVVLNHSYGQSPMVQMYFDASTGKPAVNNPWYNREYVGQYQWGYDFNHESPYTEKFIDDVNKFWLDEYHFDGFRFDFTKGFTNYAPGGNVDGYDVSRINILNRMADKIWENKNDAYIILEHWAPANEEQALGNKGMKMWRNKSYDFIPATIGNTIGSFINSDAKTHVTFYDSHDERRIAEHALVEGYAKNGYNIKDSLIMMERVKMAAAFMFLSPGPKMMWMFDELGYDINIDFNGRIGRKPLPWGLGSLKYYEDENRQKIYKAYAGILNVRNEVGPENLSIATKKHQLTGDIRRLSYKTNNIDLVLIGNFGLIPKSISPEFSKTGFWYDYFSGDSISVISLTSPISLQPGEWHIYTSKKLSEGLSGVVSVYKNPVSVSPSVFKSNEQITITFDAKLASPKSTSGLVGASKVYIHSGVVLSSSLDNTWSNTIGNLNDDGVGQMTAIGDDKWQITITPTAYYGLTSNQDISKIGMYFRDETNSNFGYGFGDQLVFLEVISNEPFITIEPAAFNADTEIKLTFNARQGNKELVGVDKVYIHSGVGTSNTTNPQTTAWNHVKGDWGSDNGIGLMTKVAGEQDKWQITLTPKSYYGLVDGDFPYWISAVFRNANGTVKGTGTPGDLTNGFIASNLDYFIKNETVVGIKDLENKQILILPNPCSDNIFIKDLNQDAVIKIFSLIGEEVYKTSIKSGQTIDLYNLLPGTYILEISTSNERFVKKFVKI